MNWQPVESKQGRKAQPIKEMQAPGSSSATQPTVCIGPGLPSLPQKMIDHIRAREYINYTDLPPGEGQVIVLQAADLVQSRKVIPDFATWSQCFSIYVAVLAPHQPERIPDLMGYQSLIARVSKKYKWPSWVAYDQHFIQEVAGNGDQPWAKAGPSLYTQCFTDQEKTAENWCAKCQALDHATADCPYPARRGQQT